MFRHFLSKYGKCLKAARMFSFELRRNKKGAKWLKIERSKKRPSRIFDILLFWPSKFKTSIFQKPIAYKIQNFQVIHKTGIHVIEMHTKNVHAKFQSNIFIFGCAMTKNQVKMMTWPCRNGALLFEHVCKASQIKRTTLKLNALCRRSPHYCGISCAVFTNKRAMSYCRILMHCLWNACWLSIFGSKKVYFYHQ